MINILKTLIKDFHTQNVNRKIFKRHLEVPVNSSKVIVITGPRRAGKSYYLYSLINDLKKSISLNRIIYINFEDERILKDNFNFQDILDACAQLYPDNELSDFYFFFDEIQSTDNWGSFIRRLSETITSNIFITGSSAKMLSSEIAASLRGRAISYDLFPLSFLEYCTFKGISTNDIYSTKNSNQLFLTYKEFMYNGGYPETVFFDDSLRIKTLQSYTDIMLYHDIIERYNIKNLYVIKDMMRKLIASSAQIFSVNKYYNDLRSRGYKISKNDLYDYLEYFTNAFFVIPLKKYSDSIAKQEQALKKIYSIDTGVITASNYTMSQNHGYLLENLVCNEFVKHNKNIFYTKNGYECDFLVFENNKIQEIIQVCFDLNQQNEKREYKGILTAAKYFNLNHGILITESEEKKIKIDGVDISVVPAWKWMLNIR